MNTPKRPWLRWRATAGHLAGALVIVLGASGCVLPSAGPRPPRVEVLPADPGALRYGRTGAEVLGHPEVGPRVRALFERDWTAAAPAQGGTAIPAREVFRQGGLPQMLRVGDVEHIAVTGCTPGACRTQRGLLLIRADGQELRARIDEGGFTHHYAFGAGLAMDIPNRLVVDGAWMALAATPGAWAGGR
ncbi:MAG: hypothetical protein HYY95_24920 [Candidatus Rokubacteria bacterium]|nr:hypothetical protein [Candidatus Rokubacteria bacterium]